MRATRAMQTLEFEFKEEVIQISLNRPHEFNAINGLMLDELIKILDNVKNDRGARGVLLTGAGRAFCYGLDLQEVQAMTDDERRIQLPVLLKKFQSLIYTIATLDRPVVAALNGFATGAGLDLALACDFRVASEAAKLSSAYVKIALIPDGGGTYFLPKMIGYGRAIEMISRGTVVPAAEAKAMGLVTSVVAPEKLIEEGLALAHEVATGPTRTFALAKATLYRNQANDLEKALAIECQGQLLCFGSNDHAEALAALKEKRKPRFKGL